MNSTQHLQLLDSLANEPESAVVRVLLRPIEPAAGDAGATVLDPKQFSSATEYRSALIALRKGRVQPGKDALVEQARKLGLTASPAASLNAVFVEGGAKRVLQLLRQVNIDYASLDSRLGL